MNNNKELEDISRSVLSKAKISDTDKFGSVIAILMMISIILTLVRVLQECNKNKTVGLCATEKYQLYGEEMRLFSKNRGWFTKMRIKKVLRQQLTREDYAKHHMALLNAILDTGENLKDDQIITLVEAANV